MEEYIIEISNFSKKYKDRIVLKDINLKIQKGKCYGFVGINGSGKTILFKAICGLINPSSGYIKVDGKEIGNEVDFPENVGMLIEEPGFLPNYSAFENLKFLADINKKIGESEIYAALKYVELNPYDNKSVKKYSLGMKQRLGVAQAIMEDPDILILDEPMNSLDKKGVKLIKEKLLELKEKGKTILLTSHIAEHMEELCDFIYEIDDGNIEIME